MKIEIATPASLGEMRAELERGEGDYLDAEAFDVPTDVSQRAGTDASSPPTRESAPPAGAAPEITPEEMEEIARREREEAEQR